jgi:hypothetical protein
MKVLLRAEAYRCNEAIKRIDDTKKKLNGIFWAAIKVAVIAAVVSALAHFGFKTAGL